MADLGAAILVSVGTTKICMFSCLLKYMLKSILIIEINHIRQAKLSEPHVGKYLHSGRLTFFKSMESSRSMTFTEFLDFIVQCLNATEDHLNQQQAQIKTVTSNAENYSPEELDSWQQHEASAQDLRVTGLY